MKTATFLGFLLSVASGAVLNRSPTTEAPEAITPAPNCHNITTEAIVVSKVTSTAAIVVPTCEAAPVEKRSPLQRRYDILPFNQMGTIDPAADSYGLMTRNIITGAAITMASSPIGMVYDDGTTQISTLVTVNSIPGAVSRHCGLRLALNSMDPFIISSGQIDVWLSTATTADPDYFDNRVSWLGVIDPAPVIGGGVPSPWGFPSADHDLELCPPTPQAFTLELAPRTVGTQVQWSDAFSDAYVAYGA